MLALGETGAHEAEQDTVDISRWQSDFVLDSWKHKKNRRLGADATIVTRPSDVLIAHKEEACRNKNQKYAPIPSALQQYIRHDDPRRLEHRDAPMGGGYQGTHGLTDT